MHSVHSWGYIARQGDFQCNKQDLAHTNAPLSCLLLFNPTISIWSCFVFNGQGIARFLICEMVCLCVKNMLKNRFTC